MNKREEREQSSRSQQTRPGINGESRIWLRPQKKVLMIVRRRQQHLVHEPDVGSRVTHPHERRRQRAAAGITSACGAFNSLVMLPTDGGRAYSKQNPSSKA
jgi:hypothetical protein